MHVTRINVQMSMNFEKGKKVYGRFGEKREKKSKCVCILIIASIKNKQKINRTVPLCLAYVKPWETTGISPQMEPSAQIL